MNEKRKVKEANSGKQLTDGAAVLQHGDGFSARAPPNNAFYFVVNNVQANIWQRQARTEVE